MASDVDFCKLVQRNLNSTMLANFCSVVCSFAGYK